MYAAQLAKPIEKNISEQITGFYGKNEKNIETQHTHTQARAG